MNQEYLIGIDIGTSATKTIVIDGNGKLIAESIQSYPLYSPKPNWFEQNPEDWWIAVKKTLREVLSKIEKKEFVKGIGLSGQMHGMVALNSKNEVIRPCIIWSDQRNSGQCQEIYDICGGIEKLRTYTNNRMLTGFTGGKILWYMQNEPRLFDSTKKILLPKDYIRLQLTGEIATDVSDASGTGLFNVCKRDWSRELMDLIHFDYALFPKCYESSTIIGRAKNELEDEFGLPAGIPVVAGGGDAVIALTGSGVTDEMKIGISIGTGGVVASTINECKENPDSLLQFSCHNIPNKWQVMGVTMGAGGALKWIKEIIGHAESDISDLTGEDVYDILCREASLIAPGSNGLIFLPHLYGSRCPHDDPHSKASLIGFTSKHTKGHIIRSVLEGVVLNLKEISEIVCQISKKPQEIIISGGGSKSNLWRQITADIFKCPVITISSSKYGSAYGAAILAGVGTGIWADVEKSLQIIKIESENHPIKANIDLYEQQYSVFKGLYPSLRDSYHKL